MRGVWCSIWRSHGRWTQCSIDADRVVTGLSSTAPVKRSSAAPVNVIRRLAWIGYQTRLALKRLFGIRDYWFCNCPFGLMRYTASNSIPLSRSVAVRRRVAVIC